MTAEEKRKTIELRHFGRTYLDIAETLNLPEGTVKSFCWRNRMSAQSPSEESEPAQSFCRNCGQLITPQPDAPPRKFCSDKCRYDWWRKNRKPNNRAVCVGCNKEFFYYGKADRKYCSHACFTKHRFGE